MSTWRERRKQELHEDIYQTSLNLFRKDGYEATTVQQITQALGIAKGTFFNHFPSKEHIVVRWYNGITDTTIKAARARRSATARETVVELFGDMAERATKEPELLIAKFRYCTDPLLMEAEKRQVEAIREILLGSCEASIESGELSAGLDISTLCDVLIATLSGTSRSWVYAKPRFDFAGVIRQRVTFLFEAFVPHP